LITKTHIKLVFRKEKKLLINISSITEVLIYSLEDKILPLCVHENSVSNSAVMISCSIEDSENIGIMN
jgi:hypothetical protein